MHGYFIAKEKEQTDYCPFAKLGLADGITYAFIFVLLFFVFVY